MKNDPKKGPNPSKRDEILAEGFDGLCWIRPFSQRLLGFGPFCRNMVRAPREAVAFRVKISCGLASRGLVQGERKAAERGGSPHASWPFE